MSEKIDTEPEVDKSGDDEVEQFGKGEVDEPGKEIVDKPGDDIVDKSGDAEVDECSDKEEDSHGVKLPPLVKSSSAKYSDKTISSKSSNGSFYLKSPKYSIWGRSNVESVLTDYGYAPGDTPALQRPETRERQSTGKKSFSFDDYDVVKARDTRQSRKEYYLKIYEDIHNLRDYCREEYFEKLEEKVCKQRKNMKKSVSFIDPSMRVPPSQKRHYYVSKIHRKPKRDVFLARNYLKNVPKSEHYKIIQLENMLRAEGKLKTQADVDEFWCTTHRPEVFKKYFLVSEQKTLPHAPTSQVPVSMVATLSNPMHQVALSEAPPSLKPMNKIIDYWQSPTVVNIRDKAGHVTSLGKRSKAAVQPALTTMKKEDDPFHHARKAAAELDRKHPQMGIPQLNCFYMDLEEQHRDPEEALRELHNIKHSKERLLFVKRLHRMYSLANANLASTQRILEKRREVELVPFQAECSVVSDLIPIQVRHSVSSLNVAESSDSRPWLKYVERKREITPIQEVSEGSTGVTERGTGERASTPTSTKSNKSTYGGRSVRVHVQDTVPICWESLVHDEDVKVLGSKTPNFYWFNYLGAGQKRSEVP